MGRPPRGDTPRKPPATVLSGRALSSSDFGREAEKLKPEIPGIPLPPPTEMIKIPERILDAPATPPASIRVHRALAPHLARARERVGPWMAEMASLAGRRLRPLLLAIGPLAIRTGEELGAAALRLRERLARTAAPAAERRATVVADTPLRTKPAGMAPAVCELRAGDTVVVHPGEDAPLGWVLARGPSGELGFLLVERVDMAQR